MAEAELGELHDLSSPWSLDLVLGAFPDSQSALLVFLYSSSSPLCTVATGQVVSRSVVCICKTAEENDTTLIPSLHHYMHVALLREGYYRNFPKGLLKSSASFSV